MFTDRLVSTTDRARSLGICGMESLSSADAASPNTGILKTLAHQAVEAPDVVDHLTAHVVDGRKESSLVIRELSSPESRAQRRSNGRGVRS